MVWCSHCTATARHFDRRRADKDLARYRRKGAGSATRLLLAELDQAGVTGRTVVDVGGGIGVIGLELCPRGLDRVVMVEASPSYIAVATEQYASKQLHDRLTTLEGDFATLHEPPVADIVTLDRVVCCYPDFRLLLDRAASSAQQTVVLSFPRDRWFVRLSLAAENLVRRLSGNSFRTFVHSPRQMAAILHKAGLRQVGHRSTLTWQVERWTREHTV